jgi:hypothetical protein
LIGVFGSTSSLPPREENGPVRDVLDLDSFERADGVDDVRDLRLVGSEHGDVADLLASLDAHEVDRAEQAAGGSDRGRERCERARSVVQMDAQRRAERRRRMRHAHLTRPSAVRTRSSKAASSGLPAKSTRSKAQLPSCPAALRSQNGQRPRGQTPGCPRIASILQGPSFGMAPSSAVARQTPSGRVRIRMR